MPLALIYNPRMTKIIIGERIGKNRHLGVGCSISIFDLKREKVLLIRRANNGKWAVPCGYMEAGGSFSEACKREVKEETGLSVRVKRLAGVYTSPNLLLEYPDGNKWQLIILRFEVDVVDGELQARDKATEFGYFWLNEIGGLDMNELDRRRAIDGFQRISEPVICDDFAFIERIERLRGSLKNSGALELVMEERMKDKAKGK